MVKDAQGLTSEMQELLRDAGWIGDAPTNLADIEKCAHGQNMPKSTRGFAVRLVLSSKVYYGDTPADAWANLWISEPDARIPGGD